MGKSVQVFLMYIYQMPFEERASYEDTKYERICVRIERFISTSREANAMFSQNYVIP